ncbi:catalase family protein [Hymenobacter bucti]|uniref:Catalase family protein n=1 Tax=Hymenobacter bucti TaxID=1844114 RepID=A0ABW4R0Y3_9BACT
MKNPEAPTAPAPVAFAPLVRYTPEVEQIPAEEPETIAKIGQMMVQMAEQVRAQHGKVMRATHAKATGLLKGELVVADDLPPELAQGMFAQPGRRYDVLARYSQGPSNPVTDKASGQRGMALKVLGVAGPHVAGGRETSTQDWVLAPDPAFINATAAGFLTNFRFGASNTPRLPEAAIVGLSYAARGVEAALETVGLSVGTLKLIGREPLHPIGHAYYSQTPSRYGDYIAKVAAFPTPETLAILGNPHLDQGQDDNAFRTAMSQFFAQHGASFELRVQLCTDLAAMPVEDASVEWPEAQSPYRTVARLTFPPQASFSEARFQYFEQRLSFNPLHALEAHRPLGGIQRARGAVYLQTQDFRQHTNQVAAAEPLSADEVPD